MIKKIFENKLNIVIGIVVVALGVSFAYSYYDLYKAKNPSFQQKIADEKNAKVISNVAKIMDIPKETPQIALVSNVDELKKVQPFFEKAQNGDFLLIYADKAILYRESNNKIINVGPTTPQNATENSASTTLPVTSAKVELRNGSSVVGKARDYQKAVTDAGFTVSNVTNASKKNYTGVTVVNLKNVPVGGLEALYGTTALTALPEGEAQTDADVVVIVGN